MDIKNVVLKQKRYSTYGWNDKDVSGNYINTLSQGEIGILLGSNGQEVISLRQDVVLDSILEVRIGSEDNQYFFNATVLSTNKPEVADYCIKTFKHIQNYRVLVMVMKTTCMQLKMKTLSIVGMMILNHTG